jgi:hypothetical protein
MDRRCASNSTKPQHHASVKRHFGKTFPRSHGSSPRAASVIARSHRPSRRNRSALSRFELRGFFRRDRFGRDIRHALGGQRMTLQQDQWASLIEPVGRELLGEPNRKLSNGNELRFGSRGSISIDLEKGTWFDFETKEGDGVTALSRARDQGEPGEWLRARGYVIDDGPPRKPNGDNTRRIDKVFDYRNGDGKLIFRVVRYWPRISGSVGRTRANRTAGTGRPRASRKCPTCCQSCNNRSKRAAPSSSSKAKSASIFCGRSICQRHATRAARVNGRQR